jgi:hypothetical protein
VLQQLTVQLKSGKEVASDEDQGDNGSENEDEKIPDETPGGDGGDQEMEEAT